jgi:hypothetical protein
MNACFAKPDIPQASTSNFENANPLRISKEEANRIKVVTITTFPLVNAMVPPMPMIGMGSINTSANSVAFLTDNISSRGRFQVVPPNEFRKKLVESKETFDKTLTQSSPPYTFFLLNDDMELNRNWQLLV